jgi:hypothetical protein
LNAFLVFIIVRQLFFKNDRRNLFATLSGLFFALFPNRAEPVIWAGSPDVVASFFFLSSLALFLKSLSVKDYRFLVWRIFSWGAALLAIFAKEMALTLPIIIFIISFFVSENQKFKRAFAKSWPYFLIVAFYFFMRYQVLGVLFGYYGPSSPTSISWLAQSFWDLIISNLFAGQAQVFFRNGPAAWILFAILAVIFVVAIRRKKERGELGIIALLFLVSTVPVIKLSIGLIPDYISGDGERYAYLPSVFFAMVLAWLVLRIKNVRLVITIPIVLLFVFVGQLLPKAANWHQASVLAETSLTEVSEVLNQSQYDGVLVVGLPDQMNGAAVFRNVFDRALSFYRTDQTVVFGIFNHSFHDRGETYNLNKFDGTTYFYQTASGKKLLAAPKNFESTDYGLKLQDPEFVERNNDHWLGSGLEITFSERLLAENRIAIIYFDGADWQATEISEN